MKINIRDLTLKIRAGQTVIVNRSALETDMKTIYEYYEDDSPTFMKSYFSTHNEFSLIPFTVQYLGNLIGVPVNISIKDDIITLFPNK